MAEADQEELNRAYLKRIISMSPTCKVCGNTQKCGAACENMVPTQYDKQQAQRKLFRLETDALLSRLQA